MPQDKKKSEAPQRPTLGERMLGALTGKPVARDNLHMGQDNPRNKPSQKIASMEPKKQQVEAKQRKR